MGMRIYIDGCTLNNHLKDVALRKSYVAVIGDSEGKEIYEKVYACPAKTNNEAEFIALMVGIQTAKEYGADMKHVSFISDSKLLVNAVRGTNNLKNVHLIKKLEMINEIMEYHKIRLTQIFWHPRENNKAGHLLDEMRAQNNLPHVKEIVPKEATP